MYIEEELLSVPTVAVLLLSKEMTRLSNCIEAYMHMLMMPAERTVNSFISCRSR